MLVERPKAFIPTEDQGYLIVAIQTPDGTGREATAKVSQQVSDLALKLEGVSDVVLLEASTSELHQPDQLGHGVRNPQGMVGAQGAGACARRRWPRKLQAAISRERSAAPWRWCSSRRRSAA